MALEAVVFPQDLFGYTMMDLCSLGGGLWGFDLQGLEKQEEEENGPNGVSSDSLEQEFEVKSSSPETVAAGGRRKRQRTKKCKNMEEVENQRKTHIAVERNRRKQMNQYLGSLRSLMPASYVQRGDQASIVGGAINFVKELEQLLQSLEAQKRTMQQSEQSELADGSSSSTTTIPFASFFTFPQYSSCSSSNTEAAANTNTDSDETVRENRPPAVADIEVSMYESHANLKVLMKRQPKQLLKMVAGLQNLHLTTLHLNVSSVEVEQMVLYSFSLTMEEGCHFACVDDIAAAVHELVGKIQDGAVVTEANVM